MPAQESTNRTNQLRGSERSLAQREEMGCAPSDVEEEALGRDVRRGKAASLGLGVDDREVGVLLQNVRPASLSGIVGRDATGTATPRGDGLDGRTSWWRRLAAPNPVGPAPIITACAREDG